MWISIIAKIFIDRGKGNKDRYILFPESFRLVLKSHLKANPRNHYLFESRRFGTFSPGACSKLCIGTGNGRVLPNCASASIPSPDALLSHIEGPVGCSDATHFG